MRIPSEDGSNFYFTREQWFQIFLTVIIIVSTLLGVFIGGWQANNAYQQQQRDELKNIAQALYIDISNVEDNFNRSTRSLPLHANNISELDNNPNYVMTTTQKYYNNNGLFYVFAKDISGFDSDTSADIYIFYSIVIDIENKREIAMAIMEKYLHHENITQYDIIIAHEISIGLYEIGMPYCIKMAEKIKRELRQKYDAKKPPIPEIVINHPPDTYNLSMSGGQIQVSTF